MTLYEKIWNIGQMCDVLRKDKKGDKGNYVPEDAILAKITAGMKKYRLLLYPSVDKEQSSLLDASPHDYQKTRVLQDGTVVRDDKSEWKVVVPTNYTWVDVDSGETLTVGWLSVGVSQNLSQAFGSSLTYANRYFLLKFFNVATVDDDPDAWLSKQHEAENALNADVVKEIVQKIADVVGKNKTPENEPQIVATLKNRIVVNGKKSANIYQITDPKVASEVLADITALFAAKEPKDANGNAETATEAKQSTAE